MTNAVGTRREIDGLAVGAATRAEAKRSGRPVAYQVALEQGWYWAAAPDHMPHLVPPYGDRARCGRTVSKIERNPVKRGVAENACSSCWRNVLGDTPRRTRQ